jgi:hypothetical protein
MTPAPAQTQTRQTPTSRPASAPARRMRCAQAYATAAEAAAAGAAAPSPAGQVGTVPQGHTRRCQKMRQNSKRALFLCSRGCRCRKPGRWLSWSAPICGRSAAPAMPCRTAAGLPPGRRPGQSSTPTRARLPPPLLPRLLKASPAAALHRRHRRPVRRACMLAGASDRRQASSPAKGAGGSPHIPMEQPGPKGCGRSRPS